AYRLLLAQRARLAAIFAHPAAGCVAVAFARGAIVGLTAAFTQRQAADDCGVRVVQAPAGADRRQPDIPTHSLALVRRGRAGSDRAGHVRAGHVAAPSSSETARQVSMSLPFAAEGEGENPWSATLDHAEGDGG